MTTTAKGNRSIGRRAQHLLRFAVGLSATTTVVSAATANAAQVSAPVWTAQSVSLQESATTTEVHIVGAGKPTFTTFELSEPARLVVDFTSAQWENINLPTQLPKNGLVRDLASTTFAGSDGNVARLVITLDRNVPVATEMRGGTLVLAFDKTATAEAIPSAVPTVANNAAQSTTQNTVVPTAIAPTTAAGVATVAPNVTANKNGASDNGVIRVEGEPTEKVLAQKLMGIDAHAQDGGTIVLLKLDGAASRYEVEKVENPERLVVDLYGISAPKNMDKVLSAAAVSKVRVGYHADKTRIVFDATNGLLPQYDVAETSEGLAIVFAAPIAGNVVAAKTTPTQSAAVLRDMGFEQKDGFARLHFTVNGAAAARTVVSSPRERIIVLDGVQADPSWLGVKNAPTAYIESVTVSEEKSSKGGVRIQMRFREDVESAIWQRDGILYWDVRATATPVQTASTNPTSPSVDRPQPSAAGYTATVSQTVADGAAKQSRFRGKKVTIDLVDADIVNVIRLVGMVSGKNVVVAEDVKGKVTISLKNVPWDQALDVILKTKDLDYDINDNIIRVVKAEVLQKERDAAEALRKSRFETEPTFVRLIPVSYATATDMSKQLENLKSSRGRLSVDNRTNVIIFEDTQSVLDSAEKLVRTLDTQTPQILIEVRMVEATNTFSQNLGIQWGGGLLFSQRGGNPTGLIFPANVGIVGGADQGQANEAIPGIFLPSNFAVNLPSPNISSGIGINLGSLGNSVFLNARLTAAEVSGQAKVISAPRVTTLNNKRAIIRQGTQLNFQTVTNNIIATQTVNADLRLEVVPHVTADGSVSMTLKINNDSLDNAQAVGGVPAINTKEITTEMLVKDGDTAVIGGIFTRNAGETYNQTPFFGDLPLIGWMFKSYSKRDDRTEMLVFLTPRIINRRGASVSTGN